MRITAKRIKNENSKIYHSFTFLELVFVNTFQVWSVNLVFCNLFVQLIHEKP
jgi:hypothetical protein